MKKIGVVILVVAGLFFAFKAIETSEWSLDKPHAKLSFTVSHMMVSDVEGWFKNFDAKISSTKADFSDAVVTMTAEVGSINTDNDMRDKDLKSAGYFDAVKFPNLTFKSVSFKKVDDQNYKVIGDITIHGITKTLELNALCKTGTNSMNKKSIAGFKITGTINRLDFGIGTATPSAMIGDDVALIANVAFEKK